MLELIRFWVTLAQFWPSSGKKIDWKWVQMVVSDHYLKKYSHKPILKLRCTFVGWVFRAAVGWAAARLAEPISLTAWQIFSIRSSVELSRPVVVHCHGHLPIWVCPWDKNKNVLAVAAYVRPDSRSQAKFLNNEIESYSVRSRTCAEHSIRLSFTSILASLVFADGNLTCTVPMAFPGIFEAWKEVTCGWYTAR